jgi:UTP-glucose-1-phosphate uridylyltransferase
MKSVRKAVLPVAGLGTRILPAAKATPKNLLNVYDRPILAHVVARSRTISTTRSNWRPTWRRRARLPFSTT